MYSIKKYYITFCIVSYVTATQDMMQTDSNLNRNNLSSNIASLVNLLQKSVHEPDVHLANTASVTKFIVTYLLNSIINDAYRCPYHTAQYNETLKLLYIYVASLSEKDMPAEMRNILEQRRPLTTVTHSPIDVPSPQEACLQCTTMFGIPGASHGNAGRTDATGATGRTGATGATGVTGTSGDNGQAGATGPTGPIGSTGATGIQGNPGATGNCGYTGNTGSIGPTGQAGAIGNKGDTGNTGPMGDAGNTGAIGGTGPSGECGCTGNTGATGNMGATGNSGPTGGPIGTNFISAYSTVLQQASTSYQNVTFSTTPTINGWATGGSPNITGFCPTATGVYHVTFNGSMQILGSSTTNRIGEMRVMLDGVEVPGSQFSKKFRIPNVANPNSLTSLSNTFLVTINPTGVLSFQMASSDISTLLMGQTSAGATTRPSLTMSIVRVQ